MTKSLPKKKRRAPAPDEAAVRIGEIIQSMIDASGHGGLTEMAATLGLATPALLKRMASPRGPFDGPSLRAALLLRGSRSEDQTGHPVRSVVSGAYVIDYFDTPEGEKMCWREK